MAKLLGEVSRGGVTRNLIMFDPLRGSDQREIGGSILLFFVLANDFLSLLDDAHHALARLGRKETPISDKVTQGTGPAAEIDFSWTRSISAFLLGKCR